MLVPPRILASDCGYGQCIRSHSKKSPSFGASGIQAAPQRPVGPSCAPFARVVRSSSRQGEKAQEFVKEARVCLAMVQSYEKCPEPADGSRPAKKRDSWSLVRYMERVKAASGLVKDRVGELMTKAVYLEFAPTARGGRKFAAEAESQWLAWETNVEKRDPEVLFDR